MSSTLIQSAGDAVAEGRVQELIRELGEYGLAVCVPHMHDEDTGEFLPLPEDKVQSESGLRVSFVDRDRLTESDIPVAWMWNKSLRVVQTCHVCRPDGPHH